MIYYKKILQFCMVSGTEEFPQKLFSSLPVWRDRRSEPHHWRPLPLEVCSLQLLLQRRSQEGKKHAKTIDLITWNFFIIYSVVSVCIAPTH